MNISTDFKAGGVIVIETHEVAVDARNATAFRDAVRSLMQHRSRVVMDLSNVTFLDSSGMGALISCLRHVRQQEGEMLLCGLNLRVRALFNLLRMDRLFTLYGSRQEALASLTSR